MKMKTLLLSLILILNSIVPIAVFANEVNVLVDGQAVTFSRQRPIIVDGEIFIPVRDVFELMGFEVLWSESTNSIVLIRDNYIATLSPGSNVIRTNEKNIYLNASAQIIESTFMLPLHAVLGNVDCYFISLDAETNTVTINPSISENTVIINPNISESRNDDGRWSPHDLEPTTVSIQWWGGDIRNNIMLEALDIFMDRYPHITVEPIYGAFSGYLDRLIVNLAATTEPDIMMVHYSWVHEIGAGYNVFLDLNTVGHVLDLSEWSDILQATMTTADGELAAVPHGLTGRLIIYNRHMLEAHGRTSFPATFDEWIEYGLEVAQGNTIVDIGENTYAFFPAGPEALDIMILTMLYNKTGRNLQENRQMLHTVDEVEAVFNILGRMIETNTIPTLEQQDFMVNFVNPVWMEGRSGSTFEWAGNIYWVANAIDFRDHDHFMNFDYTEERGVALIPAVVPGGNQAVMQRPPLGYAISRNTLNTELAAYLLNFLYTNEEALRVIGSELGIPMSRTAATITEREGLFSGLQLEGIDLLHANRAIMCPLFDNPFLRMVRYDIIDEFRMGTLNAREAAERFIADQQDELLKME
ncbi:MAG: extracellular solute-binding protein [Defluviitaleaceae bacterium]|nr:extracellular solute-binding protein [Defluviitaleaceae bacterium]